MQFFVIITIACVTMSVDCFYIQDANNLQHYIQRFGWDSENSASAIPREQTVIVVPGGGSSMPYRNIPSYPYGTNTMNRGPTIVVNMDEAPYSTYGGVPARNIRI